MTVVDNNDPEQGNATTVAAGASRAKIVQARSRDTTASRQRPRQTDGRPPEFPVEISLIILAVRGDDPMIAAVLEANTPSSLRLPRGAVSHDHSALDPAARAIANETTGLHIGYLEQLSVQIIAGANHTPLIDVAYLALLPPHAVTGASGKKTPKHAEIAWQSIYIFLPWEDWRHGRPSVIDGVILQKLAAWARDEPASRKRSDKGRKGSIRQARIRYAFGTDRVTWDETRAVERYDLLFDAGIISDGPDLFSGPSEQGAWKIPPDPRLGQNLRAGQRRLLATALARLRASIRTRLAIFELLDEEFTLFEFQRTIEALVGPMPHKQNFRRQIETAGIVEPTGRVRTNTGGRPAKLYRLSRDLRIEQAAAPARAPAKQAG